MAPKGGNAKKETGRARKAESEAKKQDAVAADKERKEAAGWEVGAKGRSKAEEREEKRKAELARRAENARLLAEEEQAAAAAKPKSPTKRRSSGRPAPKPAGPGALAAGADLDDQAEESPTVESYAASGIDNALDLLEVVTAKTDKASVGQQAAALERHPERRFKGAYEAYQEREMPNVKLEQPGLRLQQYKDILYKRFQKSPENPFNQTTVAYDASKEEKVEALRAKRAEVEERLREKSTN